MAGVDVLKAAFALLTNSLPHSMSNPTTPVLDNRSVDLPYKLLLRGCSAALAVVAVAGSARVLAMPTHDSVVDGSARMTLLACGGGGSGSYRKPAKPAPEEEGHS